MTSEGEKLLERMRRSKAGWHRKDLDSLYLSFGFTITHGSSHDIVKHPVFKELRTTLPRHNKLAKVYVQEAVKLVERLLKQEEKEDERKRESGTTSK